MAYLKKGELSGLTTIENSYRQLFKHPKSNALNVSQVAISKERSDNVISDEEVMIVKFLFDVKFATLSQIQKGCQLNVTEKNMKDMLDKFMINMIAVGDLAEETTVFKQPDVELFYSIDFGGLYLLNYEGVDTSKHTLSNILVSVPLMLKAVKQTELYISLNTSSKTIARYELFKDFNISKSICRTDVVFDLKDGDSIQSYIVFFVENGYESFSLRDNVEILNTIFEETNAWKKYYPLGTPVKNLFIVEDLKSLKATVEVLSNATDFKTDNVLITLYSDLAEKGLQNTTFYTYVKDGINTKIGKKTVNEFN